MFWIIILLLAAALLVLCYICAYSCFNVRSTGEDVPFVPKGEQYEPLREEILANINAGAELPYEDVYIQSFDGKWN